MKDESLENSVITLHSKGWSIRRISRELGISRDRISRMLVANSALRDAPKSDGIKPKMKRASKLDPYKELISELIEKYPDITGQRVYEHLKQKGFGGEITILRNYLGEVRTLAPKEPVKLVETAPGQRSAHDWSDYQIHFSLDPPGVFTQVTFFSYILSYSRRQYIEEVEDKKQLTLFRVLINAFIYLDGVTGEIKSDNQKACVDRWEAGHPVFNAKYLEFASHYRFRPLAIHPGRPTENLKVERPFYYLERSFLNGREFRDRNDLKEQLRAWLMEVNDLRIHGTTKQRPIDGYIQEHPYLQALPVNHFDTSELVHRVVNQESCVQYQGYQYVVPEKYLYETCSVRIGEDYLVVYSCRGEQIVTHPLAIAGQKERYVGFRPVARKKPDLVIGDVIARLEDFGGEMGEYIKQIKRHKPGTWRHHLRSLLALKVNYRVEDILLAVHRARQYKVFTSGAIEGFLAHNSEPRYPIKLSFKTNKNNGYE